MILKRLTVYTAVFLSGSNQRETESLKIPVLTNDDIFLSVVSFFSNIINFSFSF